MNKGYFIVYENIERNTGINRKIKSQIKAFQRCGIDIKVKEILPKTTLFGYKILFRLPFTNVSPVWKVDDLLTLLLHLFHHIGCGYFSCDCSSCIIDIRKDQCVGRT